jgi:hypothetical protein
MAKQFVKIISRESPSQHPRRLQGGENMPGAIVGEMLASARQMRRSLRDRRHAVVRGATPLRGVTVKTSDLRVSASLVLAGLPAHGARH